MTEASIRLFSGDPYRCEQALREREGALLALDPSIERHLHFGDEIDVSALAIELQSASLFSLGRHFVLRQVDRVRKPKPFAALLEDPLPDGTYLTFLATELKATNPIAKAAKAANALIALPPPRGRAISDAARAILQERDLRLTPAALRLLILRTGGDLLAIAQEADKMKAFGSGQPLDEDLVQWLAFTNAEQTAYPLYDRLGEGEVRLALAEIETLRDDPGRLLGGAIRHLTRLLMVRLLLDRKMRPTDIGSWIGQPEWLLKRLVPQARARPMKELAHLLRTGLRLDREIKRGLISATDALLLLVLAATPRARRVPG